MSAGVESLGRILARIAQGPVSSAALAAEADVPRSSAFEIIARLVAAGLVRKDGGMLLPGPLAVRLGLAAHGLERLQGPAEALLAMLRDETDGTVRLVADGTELLVYPARWDDGAAAQLSTGVGPAQLTLALRPDVSRAGRALAQVALERIGSALGSYLRSVT